MTELEQFIAKLEELERTMTGGKWRAEALTGAMGLTAHFINAGTASEPSLIEAWSPDNLSGIAHLKNSNPTVIAMLKAAIEGLKELRTHHLAGMSDQIVAHLNTLAAEALGTKGEK